MISPPTGEVKGAVMCNDIPSSFDNQQQFTNEQVLNLVRTIDTQNKDILCQMDFLQRILCKNFSVSDNVFGLLSNIVGNQKKQDLEEEVPESAYDALFLAVSHFQKNFKGKIELRLNFKNEILLSSSLIWEMVGQYVLAVIDAARAFGVEKSTIINISNKDNDLMFSDNIRGISPPSVFEKFSYDEDEYIGNDGEVYSRFKINQIDKIP